MSVLLTGGTGYIGSSVLRALIESGREVVAAVRSDPAAAAAEAAGARAAIGDLTDPVWLSDLLADSDGFVHTAAPGEGAEDFDRAVVTTAVEVLAGSGKPWVHTSGIWKFGSNLAITEAAPLDPPELVSWRLELEKAALATPGARVMTVTPGIVYGHGGGLVNLLTQAPLGADGGPRLVGDGTQHWVTVHVDDLADLYVRALEHGVAGREYVAASGDNPTVLEIAASSAAAAGITAAPEPETVEATRARLGTAFADALLLDQSATSLRARTELGWEPRGVTLLGEIAAGGYPR